MKLNLDSIGQPRLRTLHLPLRLKHDYEEKAEGYYVGDIYTRCNQISA